MTDIHSLSRVEFDVLKATGVLQVLYPGAPATWHELHNIKANGNIRSKTETKRGHSKGDKRRV